MSTAGDSLADRYGTRPGGRRTTVVVLAVVVAIAFLAWLAWAALYHADPAVSSSEIGFDIVDDHTATIEVRIQYGDGPVEAECSLRAISHDKAVVGETTYRPDPDAGPIHEIRLSTDRRATTVEWLGCRTDGQPRYR
ncbi:DUF4307 domain-containing protein [Nocardioides caeni]|uniref:DUF4307 domain-containing protein n=1 Tax=Nocardioides caeni TaxID=574700 RepID=A0A4V4HLE7_9ACTN|nr:DUF4307 domain-containing protein [Nocardioides caeni]THV17966.1 DUF4307 domain-containing protein [Nocardioides caeni]